MTTPSLSDFDELLKAQFAALVEGDAWIGNGDNLLLFGPPRGGNSHLAIKNTGDAAK